jgi:hypothetical protein
MSLSSCGNPSFSHHSVVTYGLHCLVYISLMWLCSACYYFSQVLLTKPKSQDRAEPCTFFVTPRCLLQGQAPGRCTTDGFWLLIGWFFYPWKVGKSCPIVSSSPWWWNKFCQDHSKSLIHWHCYHKLNAHRNKLTAKQTGGSMEEEVILKLNKATSENCLLLAL